MLDEGRKVPFKLIMPLSLIRPLLLFSAPPAMSHMLNSSCPRVLWQTPSNQLKIYKIGLFWLQNYLKWESCNFCTTSSIERNCSLFVLAITATVAWFGTACLSDNRKRGLIWSHYFCNFANSTEITHCAFHFPFLKRATDMTCLSNSFWIWKSDFSFIHWMLTFIFFPWEGM